MGTATFNLLFMIKNIFAACAATICCIGAAEIPGTKPAKAWTYIGTGNQGGAMYITDVKCQPVPFQGNTFKGCTYKQRFATTGEGWSLMIVCPQGTFQGIFAPLDNGKPVIKYRETPLPGSLVQMTMDRIC